LANWIMADQEKGGLWLHGAGSGRRVSMVGRDYVTLYDSVGQGGRAARAGSDFVASLRKHPARGRSTGFISEFLVGGRVGPIRTIPARIPFERSGIDAWTESLPGLRPAFSFVDQQRAGENLGRAASPQKGELGLLFVMQGGPNGAVRMPSLAPHDLASNLRPAVAIISGGELGEEFNSCWDTTLLHTTGDIGLAKTAVPATAVNDRDSGWNQSRRAST